MNLTRRQKQLIAGAVVLLVVAFIIVRRHGGAADEDVQTAVDVRTSVAVVKPFTERVQALGTVEARPGHVAEISAPAPSRISAIFVAEGDNVRAGQKLVQLDISVTQAQMQGAQATVDAARRAYERSQRLLAEGIAPRKDVEAAASDYARARADLEQASRAEQLSTLRSPINGVVTSLNGALSSPVDVTVPVVQVVDPRGLEIHFHLSPADAARITAGAKVELTSGSESDHYSAGLGTITGISAALDTSTHTVDVRAIITAPTRPLKVGESLNGAILLNSRSSSVVVPVAALVPDGEGTVVYVLDNQQIAHAVPVSVGRRTETEAEIVAGLRGGERVVTQGAYGVSDSAHVKVVR
ncbi:MAG TPA: efflux RND transporter periplasmic adaptor subunit [Longimicrobiales bacterium]